MFDRLRLMVAETQPLMVDDNDDADLVAPDCALVGKVISPTVPHTNPIAFTMRLAGEILGVYCFTRRPTACSWLSAGLRWIGIVS